MKLKLSEQKGIQILSLSENVDDQAFAILKAGVAKLMRSGKHRIVIELQSVSEISPNAAKELANLNLLAKELAGEILLAGGTPTIRKQFETLPVKPTITIRANLAEALAHLTGGAASTPAAGAGGASSAEVAALREELKALQEKILAQEKGSELGKLRQEHAEYQKLSAQLRDQVEAMVIARRQPPDEAGYLEKIRSLESQLGEAVEKVASLEASAKK